MANVCPICNNPLRQYGKDFYVCEVCETYFDKNENIVLTEQEWLQTCTTEELAIWIERIMFIVRYREEVENGAYMQTITKKDYIEKWLKQPHTNEE